MERRSKEYGRIHSWVKRHIGRRPARCQECGKPGQEYKNGSWSIHWANVSHEYKKELTDWVALCHDCHSKYDFCGSVLKCLMDKFKIGDRAYLKVKSGICFEIKIVDFRQPYGRQLYKIVPIKGTGEAEVEPATLVSKTDKKKNEDR